MIFETNILLISFAVSVVLAIIIIPILRKLKVGQVERAEGPESHLKKQGTPTMGGIIMIITMILVITGTYLFMTINNQKEVVDNLLPMLLLSLGFGIIGFIDDFQKLVLKNTKGLKPSYKMLGLLIIAVAYTIFITQFTDVGTQIYIPIWNQYITLPIYLYIPFAIFVLLGTTNAVNLTDGVDGLASSVCIIIITCLTVIGITSGISAVSILGSTVIGAVLGFLIFNLHPAKVFMGDTGSLLLGGVISGLALYLKMPLILIIIAFIPIIETVSVMIQVAYYKKTGKRVFKMTPIHHHFELSGWKENKVVIVFSLITLVLCFVAIKII